MCIVHFVFHNALQVPLGVLLKSEQTIPEMVEIMDTLEQYVPKTSMDVTFSNLTHTQDYVLPILLGGDQLTCARARGCKRARMNGNSCTERLDGLVPCCEDWHAKVLLLSVSLGY